MSDSDFTSSIPDELIIHIFSFLDLHSRVKCSLVSKLWCHLVRTVPFTDALAIFEGWPREAQCHAFRVAWKDAVTGAVTSFPKLGITHEIRLLKLASEVCGFQHLRKLVLYDTTGNGFVEIIAQNVPGLNSLHISCKGEQGNEWLLEPLVAHCSELTELFVNTGAIESFRDWDLLSDLRSLRSLRLKTRVLYEEWAERLKELTFLEELHYKTLVGCQSLTTLTQLLVLTCCWFSFSGNVSRPNIRRLEFGSNEPVRHLEITEDVPNLRFLCAPFFAEAIFLR